MKAVLKRGLVIGVVLAVLAVINYAAADTPTTIDYYGEVRVNGIPFNGTGNFKFAIVDSTDATTYWSNDETSTAGSEPENAVSLTVTNGTFNVLLGDTSIPNMRNELPADIFYNNSSTYLSIWFDDGVNGSQHLKPNKPISSVAYAQHAQHAQSAGSADTLGGLSAPSSGDLVGTSSSQSITNKTIDGNSNTLQNVSDSALQQITAADKVAGSAVQLAAAGGLENDSGLKVKTGSGLLADADGIKLNIYDAIVAPVGGDYTTLAAACAGEAAGASIFIKNGTYNENEDVMLKNGQKLIGETRDGVIVSLVGHQLKAEGDEPVTEGDVDVAHDSETVTGNNVPGWSALSANDYIILNNVPYLIENVNGSVLTLAKAYRGKALSGSAYYAGTFYDKIELANITVVSGVIGKAAVYFRGVINSVVRNIVVKDGKPNGTDSLEFKHCWNNKVEGAKLRSCRYGLFLSSSSSNQLSNISANNNVYGIYLLHADNNSLENIHADNNDWHGLYFNDADNNRISNLSASHNNQKGILLNGGSSYNLFCDVVSIGCTGPGAAFASESCSYNSFINIYTDEPFIIAGVGNCISASVAEEIELQVTARYNRIVGCQATKSGVAVNDLGSYNSIVGCVADEFTYGANCENAGNVNIP